MWLSGLRTQHCLYQGAGCIPGLTQWIKGPALLQAAARITDAAGVRCCCDCGIGLACSSNQPLTQECPCATGVAIKRKKNQKKNGVEYFLPLAFICNPLASFPHSGPFSIVLGATVNNARVVGLHPPTQNATEGKSLSRHVAC